MAVTTWRHKLKDAFERTGDDFNKIETTLSDGEMDVQFDDGYGSDEGMSFTVWGEKYVYFPLEYDGSEYVGWAPRNPCAIIMGHQ